jgi:cystathionine beta-lyase/cystathionine gamma-synthase
LCYGVDWVVHSTSKYLNGHSDMIGGCLVSRHPLTAQHRAVHKNLGGTVNALDAWLMLRGLRTLALRMEAHNRNGQALATYLARHPKVRKVYYPGLPDHPQHALASRQMQGFGGMLAFDMGSLEAARIVLNGVRLMALAESLGGVETLISHPATMTHASVPRERRAAIGITDGLVRISAGVEDIDDLLEDLEQAIARVP